MSSLAQGLCGTTAMTSVLDCVHAVIAESVSASRCIWLVIDQFFAEDIPGHASLGGSPPVALEVTPGGYVDLDVRGGAKASASAVDPRDDEYPISQATPGQWQSLSSSSLVYGLGCLFEVRNRAPTAVRLPRPPSPLQARTS